MTTLDERQAPAPRPKRADARRNEQTLLDAAAAVFVASGVNAPVRDIATKAGVGVGTIYRHFPTRSDLIVAVYRHQVEACAEAGPALMASSATAHNALAQWVSLFVDFLVTKHGLAGALQPGEGFDSLHTYFINRLVPVCAELLDAAADAGEIRADVGAYEFMRAIGSLCAGMGAEPAADTGANARGGSGSTASTSSSSSSSSSASIDLNSGGHTEPHYDARRMVTLLVAGLRHPLG